jgi:chemotaxis protein MotB
MSKSASSGGQEYLVSVSDLMAGLIFIFIITLMIFVLQFQTITASLQSAEGTRGVILTKLADELGAEGLEVEIVEEQGILRLTGNSVNFAFGATDPIPDHLRRIDLLGRVMLRVLPCFVHPPPEPTCEELEVDRVIYSGLLSLVLIEGHTDAAPVGRSSRFRDNVELSGLRAASVYRLLRASHPTLDSILVRPGERRERILSISGYGAQRRLAGLDSLDSAHRRIDLRFLMEPARDGIPASEAVLGGLGER